MSPERFMSRAMPVTESGCWLWVGAYRPSDGYGYLKVGKKNVAAHRHSFSLFGGALLEGRELDHLCRVRRCVNPAHLEQVTRAEHARRSLAARKTCCANGHEFTEANTYIRPSGQRDCRACIRARVRRYKARKAA